MNNQGSSQWNPDQTYSTDPDIGQTQQFGAVPQQQYGQPNEYPSSYQQPEKRGGPSPWLYVLAALLLAALVGADGRPLSRDYLIEVVSNRQAEVDIRTVDALVARLRRKLVGSGTPVIATVTGVGYKLALSERL